MYDFERCVIAIVRYIYISMKFCASLTLIPVFLIGCSMPSPGGSSSPTPGQISWMPYDVHSNMSYFYGMVVGDFYNDGQPAIAYADSFTSQRAMMRHDKDAVVYLNTLDKGSVEIFREDMSFAPSQVDRVKLIERMVAMDINGDGLMDIVAIANSHDSVVAYLNRGPDVAWERLVLTVETPGAVNLALADPDGDGDLGYPRRMFVVRAVV